MCSTLFFSLCKHVSILNALFFSLSCSMLIALFGTLRFTHLFSRRMRTNQQTPPVVDFHRHSTGLDQKTTRCSSKAPQGRRPAAGRLGNKDRKQARDRAMPCHAGPCDAACVSAATRQFLFITAALSSVLTTTMATVLCCSPPRWQWLIPSQNLSSPHRSSPARPTANGKNRTRRPPSLPRHAPCMETIPRARNSRGQSLASHGGGVLRLHCPLCLHALASSIYYLAEVRVGSQGGSSVLLPPVPRALHSYLAHTHTAATLLRRHCPAWFLGRPRVGMAAAGTRQQLGRLLGGLWFLLAALSLRAAAGQPAVATVDARRAVAATGEDFVCATLDWWPPDKCDYGTCAWGRAGLLNLVSE